MAEMEFVPLGDCILVKDNDEAKVIDGIELPPNTREKEMVFGMVITASRKFETWAGGTCYSEFPPGTIVCYGPYAGKTIVLGGTELRMVREGQLEGYMREKNHEATGDNDAGRPAANA